MARSLWHDGAMRSATTKNLHVPLPASLYRRLRQEADKQHRPATQIARDAIVLWLSQQQRRAAEDDLRAYVDTMSSSPDDLDPDLEAAAVDLLREKRRK